MKTKLLLLAAVLAVLPARADNRAPVMDADRAFWRVPGMKTDENGFSAQFWMTTDEAVFNSWVRSGAIRNLVPAAKVKRSVPVHMALFLANPGVRRIAMPKSEPQFFSDVSFDLYLVSPSNTLNFASRNRTAWKGTPPSPGLVSLAADRVTLNFEAIDKPGEYTIFVVLTDNVRKTTMKLERKLELVD